MNPPFSSLAAWLDWQERLHPVPMALGLDRIGEVWRRLWPAGLGAPVISVGGTNGKGSSVAMLEAILGAAGYRVGCYSSPHLLRYNERVRLQGREAEDEALCSAFERVEGARAGISLTYFEFGTLAALDLFARACLDVVVLEVGLGGRLDAVNIVDADVAIVTTIAFDHTEWLGDSLDRIAEEKAGIFRSGRPAVIGSALPRLTARANEIGAHVLQLERDYGWREAPQGWTWWGPRRRREALPWPRLRGRHQLDNAAAVLMALDCLSDRLPVAQQAVRQGLATASLPGRFQVLPGAPTLVFDVAHNPQGAQSLAANLCQLMGEGRLHGVCGLLADKDAEGLVRPLTETVDAWYLARPDSPRGMSAERLAQRFLGAGVERPLRVLPSVADAVDAARAQASPEDKVLVFGSFVTVGEAMRHLGMG
jgi:dihydrofolate synthase/folylpolyglutamate synthase